MQARKVIFIAIVYCFAILSFVSCVCEKNLRFSWQWNKGNKSGSIQIGNKTNKEIKRQFMEIETKDFVYTYNQKEFEGYLSIPKELHQKTPSILLIHEWVGLGDYIKMRARKFAKLGYIAFAMDMYGKGVRAKNHQEAGELMEIYMSDRKLMIERTRQAIGLLKSQEYVDPNRIAVVGYCFGGAVVLELALSGEKLSGGVSFHGVLNSPNLETNAKNIQMELLFHHGSLDPMMSSSEIQNLKGILDREKIQYSFVSHPQAAHSFTRISANDENVAALQYNEKADKESWSNAVQFLERIFSQ